MPKQPSKNEKTLAERVADRILSMITLEKSLCPGDKLPNENEFSAQLHVSRTTLREAVRILASHHVLEIRRGKGTFVVERPDYEHPVSFQELTRVRIDVKDLYEMRLIFEPQAAYYAARRATGEEIEQILSFGRQVEECIRQEKDRTDVERAFHNAIAKATHNEFVERLVPIIYEAIEEGVILSEENEEIIRQTLADHQMIMEFMEKRDGIGAQTSMQLHIIHAMRGFGIQED